MRHQYEAYGGWSFSNIDYYNENIMEDIKTPEARQMFDIIDPYGTNGMSEWMKEWMKESIYE